ncbi:MAG: site-specific integrase [Acidobacteria bacterium]|nr:MAG: site-specific integrase [Acidobacteriota bacterium]GIK77714.1 MAG: site-specific integrase [Actinomycetes bacterium]
MSRRSYGTGSLYVRRSARGGEAWYGKWWAGDRRVQRKIGPKRQPGSREGLTRAQAERELQRRMESERAPVRARVAIEEAGERYIEHLEHVLERKPTTVADYGYILRGHLAPFFGATALERLRPEDVSRYLVAKRGEGLATKTITNHLVFLHGLFAFAVKRGWAQTNPVDAIDRPRADGGDPDIRYLTLAEVEALLRAIGEGRFAVTDRALYLTAAMTGLRQGELLALRWGDVDWRAGRLRVRRTFTRGSFGAPKSRRSSRSVPLTDRVAGALERHFQASVFQADEDLVFCNPHTGRPMDASRMRKRFKKALARAGIRPVRFHDLRHTFGTHCAAAGVPLRILQEWMGHRDAKTTQVYADYAPSEHEGALVERAFLGTSDKASFIAPHDEPSDNEEEGEIHRPGGPRDD